MNSVHDLGGMDGLALVGRNQGPALKHQWERDIWGVAWSMLARQFTDRNWIFSRADLEAIPPHLYLSMPYYAKWLYAWERALVRAELVTWEELADPTTAAPAAGSTPFSAAAALQFLTNDVSFEVPPDRAPRFRTGDAVTVRNEHPAGHTRAPRYTRGRRGMIEIHHGMHVFEDQLPRAQDPGPQHLYTVSFSARELWGSRGHPNDSIKVDLTEFHLEPAEP